MRRERVTGLIVRYLPTIYNVSPEQGRHSHNFRRGRYDPDFDSVRIQQVLVGKNNGGRLDELFLGSADSCGGAAFVESGQVDSQSLRIERH